MENTTKAVNQIFDETISTVSLFDSSIRNKIVVKIMDRVYLAKDQFYSLSKVFCLIFSQNIDLIQSVLLDTDGDSHGSVSITLNRSNEEDFIVQVQEATAQYGLTSFIRIQRTDSQISLYFPVITYIESDAIIETKQLVEYFPDFDSAKMLVELFLDSFNAKIKELKKDFDNKQWTNAHRLCHSLKGGAFTICAMRLGNLLKNLEEELKQIIIYNEKISYNKMKNDITRVKKEAKVCLEYWNQLDLNTMKEHFNGST